MSMAPEVVGTLIGKTFAMMAMIVLMGMIFTFPVLWLWNGMMPDLFGLPSLTFWQTFGLCVMVRLILSGTSVITTST